MAETFTDFATKHSFNYFAPPLLVVSINAMCVIATTLQNYIKQLAIIGTLFSKYTPISNVKNERSFVTVNQLTT